MSSDPIPYTVGDTGDEQVYRPPNVLAARLRHGPPPDPTAEAAWLDRVRGVLTAAPGCAPPDTVPVREFDRVLAMLERVSAERDALRAEVRRRRKATP